MKECLPFLAKDEHEGGVASRCVDGSEWHDVEGAKDTLRASKTQFGSVGVTNADLVEARFGVHADPMQFSSAGGEVVNGFIASWDGKVVYQGDGVESAVGDA